VIRVRLDLTYDQAVGVFISTAFFAMLLLTAWSMGAF